MPITADITPQQRAALLLAELADRPLTLAQAAKLTGLSALATHRLLRCLAQVADITQASPARLHSLAVRGAPRSPQQRAAVLTLALLQGARLTVRQACMWTGTRKPATARLLALLSLVLPLAEEDHVWFLCDFWEDTTHDTVSGGGNAGRTDPHPAPLNLARY